MLGWSGADTPLVSVEEILTYDDDCSYLCISVCA